MGVLLPAAVTPQRSGSEATGSKTARTQAGRSWLLLLLNERPAIPAVPTVSLANTGFCGMIRKNNIDEVFPFHGITDEDVKDCPTFKEIAKSLATQIEGCDLAGYNSNRFDIPMLAEEFLRAGVDIDLNRRKFIDVQTIFHKMEQRTLSAAYKFYCNKSLENAHTAEADTLATYEVLKAQLDRYPDLKNDVAFLSQYSCYSNNVDFAGRMVYNDKGEEVINFGKYKGRLVTEILKSDPGYYSWIMNGDFPLNTKKMLTEIRLRDFNSK